MKISVKWKRLKLRKGAREGLIYVIDLDKIPDSAGVYVLGRKHGQRCEALYVGKALELKGRVKGQLNNLKLMRHVQKADKGERFLLFGEVITKPGQNSKDVIRIVEKTLIRHFMSEGHDLVNKQGTSIREHEIDCDGNQPKKFIPRSMFLEKK